jgi:hypothetical protein
MSRVTYLVPFCFLLIGTAQADLPLTVENLLSDKGKTRFKFSTTYANSEKRRVDASNPLIVQTGPTSFVTVPTVVGENLTNTDVVVSTVGLSHGITSKDEIYGRASALAFDSRSESATGVISQNTDSQFADVWVGINHKFRKNTDKAAVLGFAEIQLAERQSDDSTAAGKSFVLGATTYQTYDPIVLSLTGAVQFNSTRTVNGTDIKRGNSLSLSPTVGFAVNDKVTLSTGLNWRIKQATTRNGVVDGVVRTRTRLNLKMGYALGKMDTLSFGVRPDVAGDSGVQMSFNWNHRFKKH